MDANNYSGICRRCGHEAMLSWGLCRRCKAREEWWSTVAVIIGVASLVAVLSVSYMQANDRELNTIGDCMYRLQVADQNITPIQAYAKCTEKR